MHTAADCQPGSLPDSVCRGRLRRALRVRSKHDCDDGALQLVHCRNVCEALRGMVEGDEGSEAWQTCCRVEFGLVEPCLPPRLGAPSGDLSFRAAWTAWRREFSDFYNNPEDAQVLQRSARTWAELNRWLRANAPPIASSLAPGLSRIEVAELDPMARLPAAVRAIYRIHNGQPITNSDHGVRPTPLVLDPHSQQVHSAWNGIFGGYIFYDHVVNLRMPPLEEAIKFGRQCAQKFAEVSFSEDQPDVPLAFAVSLITRMGRPSRMYILHNKTGSLYLPRNDGTLLRCVNPAGAMTPDGAVIHHQPTDAHAHKTCGGTEGAEGAKGAKDTDQQSSTAEQRAGLCDGALRWLEAYVSQLTRGNYAVAPYLKDELEWGGRAVGISLYPRQAPMCAVCITRNIRIEASAMFVPEKSSKGSFFFSYRMRMSLVGEGSTESTRSAQLITRHLVFNQGPGREPVVVDGEAVIGEFPHLIVGGSYVGGQDFEYAGKQYVTEYCYASCTEMPTAQGSLSGSFRFLPGCIATPTGRCFMHFSLPPPLSRARSLCFCVRMCVFAGVRACVSVCGRGMVVRFTAC